MKIGLLGKKMKPNKITKEMKGGEGSIIVASFGTFLNRNQHQEFAEHHICFTIEK